MSRAGGYLSNPDSTSACRFCSFRNTDQFLDLSFNIKYSNRWRDVGIFIAFIAFNVRTPMFSTHGVFRLMWFILQAALTYLFTYLFRMKRWDESRLFKRFKPQKESVPQPRPQPTLKPKDDEVF